ncbi:hypothetical protein Clacol_004226 [Clathrus columnatus]|uniref:Uncharacterized protein n=1 Tax=Clathrus columnatus TaxID=1419009 RepID=A0AAV5ADK0_9AGAM|nr:hypothetical protein Clacol_004226 [Clathrus columnatus]
MSINSVKGAAIVTGAAQGIGKAIAIRLAKDGYDMALNDVPGKEDLLHTLADEIISQGRKSTIIIADVTNEKSVVEMIKRTVSELGILRVMVANAGIALTIGTEFLDTRLEDFEKVLKVNLMGVFLCYREAARQMVQQGTWGRASSVNGKRESHRDEHLIFFKEKKNNHYRAAAEMKKYGITVNAYAPGYIDTPMARQALSVNENLSNEEIRQQIIQRGSSSSGLAVNLGTPEDIANFVSYLASEESKFMTGQAVSVNGGVFFG